MNELESESNDQGGGGRGIARPHPHNDKKLCYTVPEAAKLLRVSRNQGYELVHRGVIPVIMLETRIRVPIRKFHEKFGNFPESEVGK
ncbi:helix-turn-helix domain-containing protein [Chloroflexota bacterium]